jgi:hypothetical protein
MWPTKEIEASYRLFYVTGQSCFVTAATAAFFRYTKLKLELLQMTKKRMTWRERY